MTIEECPDPAQRPGRADVRALVTEFDRLGVRPYEELGVLLARRAMASVTKSQSPKRAIAQVTDVLVPGAQGQLPVRIYDPAPASPLPVVIYLHGGGFSLGGVHEADGPCRRVARSASAVVMAVEYRLAPESPFPQGLDDVTAAIDHLITWDRPGGVTARVVLGDSAGGHLAASVAISRRGPQGTGLDGLALIYPCVRPAAYSPFSSYVDNANAPLMTRRTMEWFWDLYVPAGLDPTNPRLDLLQVPDLSGLPPTLVVTAELDPLRDEGRAFATRLEHDGSPVLHREFQAAPHGFWWLDGPLQQAAELDILLARFIASVGG